MKVYRRQPWYKIIFNKAKFAHIVYRVAVSEFELFQMVSVSRGKLKINLPAMQ